MCVDSAILFGIRLVLLLFPAVGDALQWIMLCRGVSWLGYYMNDFVAMGVTGSPKCEAHLRFMKQVCMELGMQLVVRGA